MDIFMGELVSERVRLTLGRALGLRKIVGQPYTPFNLFFFLMEEISFQSHYFAKYSIHKNGSCGHIHAHYHNRVIYSLGDSKNQVMMDRLLECKLGLSSWLSYLTRVSLFFHWSSVSPAIKCWYWKNSL